MKTLLTFFFSLICFQVSSQNLIGEYKSYTSQSIELKSDSTFRYEWRIHMGAQWANGKWKVLNKVLHLDIVNVYDTLIRPNTSDSLVISLDDKSNRVDLTQFVLSQISSGRQAYHDETTKFAIKGSRLYPIDKNGRIKRKRRDFSVRKKKMIPAYYFKVE